MSKICEVSFLGDVLHDARKLLFGIPNYGFPIINYDYNLLRIFYTIILVRENKFSPFNI